VKARYLVAALAILDLVCALAVSLLVGLGL
jgi:hypothetical protein